MFNNLIDVYIPDSVISIGEYAFAANNILNINFGEGLTSIGNKYYNNNSALGGALFNNYGVILLQKDTLYCFEFGLQITL